MTVEPKIYDDGASPSTKVTGVINPLIGRETNLSSPCQNGSVSSGLGYLKAQQDGEY